MGASCRAVASVLGAAALVPLLAGVAAAQEEDRGEDRSVELRYRWVDLEYRTATPDNSERVERTAEETTVALAADVLFEYDRADLGPDAQARLQELTAQLEDLGPRTVTIAGHTDNHGDPAYNQDLSSRRAQAVSDALHAVLGDGYTFEVSGHGETEPVAANEHPNGSDNPEGRALNRRVEISFPSD